MSVTLADLVARLQTDIPARDGHPTLAQYEQAVKDAVADYSRRNPMTLIANLAIVSGTATYNLSNDFIAMIQMDTMLALEGVIHTAGGLVPTSTGFSERYTINGRTITFAPTPAYTLTRTYRYAAIHVLDDDDAYPYLTNEDCAILLLKAQALALRKQAFSLITTGSGEIVEYAVGDERVKKSSPSEKLNAAASSLEAQYLEQVQRVVGIVGSRARYAESGELF